MPAMAFQSPPARRAYALHEETEKKPDNWRGAGPWKIFPAEEGRKKRPEDETGYLGAEILDNTGPVKAQRPRDVAGEARHAYPHVSGISEVHKQ